MRRQLREGVSVAHFSFAGARLTGNTPIPGAPTVVLLGDSYVVAEAVGDQNTMGSYLERSARSGGVPLNVRQYGWSGASPSQYLLVGDAVLRRWNPADVVIAVSDNDFDYHALYEGTPRLRVNAAGTLVMLPEPPRSRSRNAAPVRARRAARRAHVGVELASRAQGGRGRGRASGCRVARSGARPSRFGTARDDARGDPARAAVTSSGLDSRSSISPRSESTAGTPRRRSSGGCSRRARRSALAA